jgi:PAS domain S-box-containing protein
MVALLLVVAGIGLIAIAAYSWRYRHKPAAQTFALLMASFAHWLLCIAGWSFSPTPETAIFWLWFQFLGVGSVPPLLFRYVLQFTGRGERLTLWRYLMLWVVPAITQLLAWTNSAHQIEQMEDGMLVIDQHDQIIDLNPAMQQLLEQRANDLLGKPIAIGLAHLPTLLHAIEHATTDIEVPLHQHPQFYDLRVRPLIRRSMTAGIVVILHNITQVK